MTQSANVVRHLATRQLPAFSGLGPLGHLDLNLVRAGQVFRSHPKPARGHLFNFGTHGVARIQGVIHLKDFLAQKVRHGLALLDRYAFEFVAVAQGIFAAFARIAFSADAVHGDGQRRVGFRGNGAQGHRTGGKAFDDLFG